MDAVRALMNIENTLILYAYRKQLKEAETMHYYNA